MFSLISRDYGKWTNGVLVSLVRLAADAILKGPTGNPYVPVQAQVSFAPNNQKATYLVRNGIELFATVPFKIAIGGTVTPDVFTLTQTDVTGSTVVWTDSINFKDAPTFQHLINWINLHVGFTAKVIGPAYYPSSILDALAETSLLTGIVGTPSDTFFQAEEACLGYQLWSRDPLVVPSLTYTVPNPTITATLPIPTPGIDEWTSVLYAAMFASGKPGPLPGIAEGDGSSTYLANGAGDRYDDISTDTLGLQRALLLAESIQTAYVWVQSVNTNVQNLLKAHCETLSDVTRGKYRIFLAGINFVTTSPVDGATLAAATVDDAVTAAANRAPELNGPVVLAFDGTRFPNPTTGTPEQFGGLGFAAQLLGMAAGMPPGQPLTNKTLNSQGLEFPLLTDSQIDQLLSAGVTFPFYLAEDGTTRIMQGLTCFQTDDPSQRLFHGLRIQHTVLRLWDSVLSKYKGFPMSLDTGEQIRATCAIALDASILSGSNPNGFLTEGKVNGQTTPAWDSMEVVGDTNTNAWTITANVHPVGETDYIIVRTKFLPTIIELS